MAVKLKDAKITVKIDLQSASKDVGSLEERTKKQREDAAKQKKAQAKEGKIVGAARGARGVVSAAVGGGLYQMVTNIVRSLPLGIGTALGVGIAAEELNERFGPLIQGIIEKEYGDRLDMLKKITNYMSPILGYFLDDLSGASRDWSELKAELTGITAGLEAGLSVGAADILTGGTFESGEFADVFGKTREYAKAQTLLGKAIRRMNNRLIGEGITRSAKQAIEDALGSGSEQK